MRRLGAGLAVALSSCLLAACSGAGGVVVDGTGGSANSVLSIAPGAAASGPFAQDFNPLLPTSNQDDGQALFAIYEPLYMVNSYTGKSQPWLATSYQWGPNAKSLTIHTRSGVAWSDGKPFSADDVAYTFNLKMKYPALNSGAMPISSVSEPDNSTVVINFRKVAYTYLGAILATQPVPKHLWQKVSDPSTYQNPSPVGTGPYTLAQFTPQVITMKKNPHYWQKGMPSISEVRYLAFDSVSSMLAAAVSGQVQWASQKFAGGLKPFTSRDPVHNLIGAASGAVNTVVFNTTVAPLDQVVVRKAFSMALNRPAISQIAEMNINPPESSPTGLNAAIESKFIAPQYRSLSYTPDAAGARELLQNAGYKMGSNGVMVSPQGTPLSFTVLLATGAPDLVTEAQLIASQVKPVGIQLNIQTVSTAARTSAVSQGHFQITMGPNGQPTANDPYQLYRTLMDFTDTKAIGKPTTIDQGRYNNPAANKLLAQYAAAAPGSAAQTAALYGLEQIMVDQVPAVPIFFVAGRSAYSTATFTGWPSASNNYAPPLAYFQTAELILLNLKAR